MKTKYRRSIIDHQRRSEAQDYEKLDSFRKKTWLLGHLSDISLFLLEKYERLYVRCVSFSPIFWLAFCLLSCGAIILDTLLSYPNTPMTTNLIVYLISTAQKYLPFLRSIPTDVFLVSIVKRFLFVLCFTIVLFVLGLLVSTIILLLIGMSPSRYLLTFLSNIYVEGYLRQCGAVIDNRTVKQLPKIYMKDFRSAEVEEHRVFVNSDKYSECPSPCLAERDIHADLAKNYEALNDEYFALFEQNACLNDTERYRLAVLDHFMNR